MQPLQLVTNPGIIYIVCGKMRHSNSPHRVDKYRGRDVNKSPKQRYKEKLQNGIRA